ncbi:MAG: hypothetical protein ACRBK7_06640 [Acidimicrobiales bacterium]
MTGLVVITQRCRLIGSIIEAHACLGLDELFGVEGRQLIASNLDVEI